MNTSQIQSLVRWLLNAISGGVLAYSAAKSPATQSVATFVANLLTGADMLAACVLGATWLWGHITHGKTASTNSGSASTVVAVLLLGALAVGFTGCVALDKNARPVIVRAEQSLSIATATFDAVVKIDDSNRPFFRTNAVPFHQFCEWLRYPVVIAPLTNSFPRGLAIIRSADAVKETYKRTNTTNDYAALISALATVETTTAQAQAWLNSVKH